MVAVTAAVATAHSSYGHSALRFVEELAIGSAAGVVGGLILLAGLHVTRQLTDGVQAVAIVLGVVLLGAGTASLHGSGFLAVYIAGLLLSDAWARQDGDQHVVPEALSTVAEPLLFATLGAAFAPLVGLDHIGYGIFLTVDDRLPHPPARRLRLPDRQRPASPRPGACLLGRSQRSRSAPACGLPGAGELRGGGNGRRDRPRSDSGLACRPRRNPSSRR